MKNLNLKRSITNGSRCSCSPDRYVRFCIPDGLPGIGGFVSCRDVYGTGASSIRHHELPDDFVFVVKVPE